MTTEYINDINERRAARRASVRANRPVVELLKLDGPAFINIEEMSALTKMSVEALLMQRSRKLPPIGFRHGREIRYTMHEFRELPAKLAQLEAEEREKKRRARAAA